MARQKIQLFILEQKNHIVESFTPRKEPLPRAPEVKAKSYVIYDIRQKRVLLSEDATTSRALASLTKIKTAHLFLTRPYTETIRIPSFEKGHLYDYGLREGDIWETSSLIAYMLTISSNDAAEILAAASASTKENFVSIMNETSSSTSLTFTTPNGLDKGSIPGGFGSALDIAKEFAIFYEEYPLIVEKTTKKTLSVVVNGEKKQGIPNTNPDVEKVRGVIGSKTGYTTMAGGNLAIIADESFGNPVVIVVLGSTKEGRFEDIKALLAYVHAYGKFLYQE